MSSDNLCFSALEKKVHKLLRTEPSTVEYEFSYLTSTNTGRLIRASLRDDGDLLDLLHEQTAEMVVYVISRYLSSSGVGPSVGTDYRNLVRDDYVPYFPQSTLMDSLMTEFAHWIRTSGNTDRLLGLTGAVPSSSAGLGYAADRGSSNWVVPLTDLDIAGPLSWDERRAAPTDTLREGAIFRTKDALALAVGIYHMQNRVEYCVYRSNRRRLGYVCKHGGDCPFKCFAVAKGQMWRIYKFNGTHTCHLDMSRVAPRQVPARVLAKYFARKLVDERTVLKPKEMIAELVREFGIHIDYSFALRTRNISIEMLPAFLHTLQLMNPGTLVDLHVTSDYAFKHMFLAIGSCVRAFLQFARPVLVVDGTHLKGKNKGVLFVAVTRDEDLLIISDQHQSIKNAVASVFPRAAHGLCYYHLKNKMTKRGKNVLALFEDAAYSYRTDIFQANMSMLEQVCPNAYVKLCNIGPQHWSRSQCPVRRYNFMTSNAAESLNARLLWARRLPVCSLLEVYRSIVERWFVERRAAAHVANHVLTGAAVEKLSGSVEQGRRYALDLITCSHAAAAICATGGLIYDYVGSCYKVESLIGMYSEVIQGLPRPEEWIIPDAYRDRVVIPPDIRRRAGCPPLSRARAPFEASSSARRQFCTRCQGPGHNRRVCTASVPIGYVDLNSQPDDASTRRRAPKRCNICGITEHTRPKCPIRLSAD
ncbi:hypothetical protein C2S52_012160 [Perilla frutescens var. hirtella]|nr:hypothetical protein C2S52_012160 [Perilla frutescens var. hirtella]